MPLMNQAPVISVCIANFNGREVIVRCLEAVRRQQCSAAVEIIVHDDASTDGSADLVEQRYPDVRMIRSKENVGFCTSNNRMAMTASGSHILLLNNDAFLRPGALQALLDAAVRGFDGVLSLPQYSAEGGALLDLGSAMDCFLMPIPITATDSGRAVTVMGACLWIPRELWKELGGFPDWLGSIGEDLFLCLAAWNAGRQIRVLNDAGYDHVVGHSFGGGKSVEGRLRTTVRRRFLSERNRLCVLAVFCPALLMPLWMSLQILWMLAEGVAMSLVRRDARILREVYLRAIASAWALRRSIWTERRRLTAEFGRFPLRRWFSLVSFLPQKLRAVWRHGIPHVR